MEDVVVTNVACEKEQAKITLSDVPDIPGLAAQIFGPLAKAGVVVVRSTRLPSGITLRNNEVNDDEKGFVASGELNPAKSRVLLQLALTKTTDPLRIQKMFYEYWARLRGRSATSTWHWPWCGSWRGPARGSTGGRRPCRGQGPLS